MRRPLLALLAAACIAAPDRALAAPLAPRALVDSVAAQYAARASYHVAGALHIAAHADSVAQPYALDVEFELARRGGRAFAELSSSQMSSLLVCDGDSVWTVVPATKQFNVGVARRNPSGDVDLKGIAQALMVAEQYATLTQGVDSVRDLGPDTLQLATGTVTCRRIEIGFAPDSAQPDAQRDRVVWIDEARRLVLRDSVFATGRRPGQGRIVSEQSVRFAQADDASGRDSLFRFRPHADWQRVVQFAPPPPPQAAMIGQAAKPFALAGLDGKRVTLASLRGKIVVLDFWATWCGPCRRWMPIVAGMRKQLASHADVRFYAINVGDSADKVKDFLAQTPEVVPVLLDLDKQVGSAYGATAIPLTVVVGRDGKVAQVLLGLHPEADLREALKTAGVRGL